MAVAAPELPRLKSRVGGAPRGPSIAPWHGRLRTASVDHNHTTRRAHHPCPVMASGARRASAKARLRTVHPVHIRQWVIERPPDHIYAELVRRRDALDEAIRPAREALVQGSRLAAERLVLQLEGTAQPLPEPPREVEEAVARLIAANMVAAYWAEHPYDGPLCLPPIMTVGAPWTVWPDMVHVLDLPPELIRLAIERGGSLDAIDRDASPLHQAQPGLFTLHATVATAPRLRVAVTAEGATPRLMALARKLLGLRVDRRELQRWAHDDARGIARDVLGGRLKKSRKTLQDQLRLAEQAHDIQESWNEFMTYFATLSEPQRRRAVLLP